MKIRWFILAGVLLLLGAVPLSVLADCRVQASIEVSCVSGCTESGNTYVVTDGSVIHFAACVSGPPGEHAVAYLSVNGYLLGPFRVTIPAGGTHCLIDKDITIPQVNHEVTLCYKLIAVVRNPYCKSVSNEECVQINP